MTAAWGPDSALVDLGQTRFFRPLDLNDDAVLDDRQNRPIPEAPEGVVDPVERRMAGGGFPRALWGRGIVFRRQRGGGAAHGLGLVTGLGPGVR